MIPRPFVRIGDFYLQKKIPSVKFSEGMDEGAEEARGHFPCTSCTTARRPPWFVSKRIWRPSVSGMN